VAAAPERVNPHSHGPSNSAGALSGTFRSIAPHGPFPGEGGMPWRAFPDGRIEPK
jgi:hypothetical protein